MVIWKKNIKDNIPIFNTKGDIRILRFVEITSQFAAIILYHYIRSFSR